jgi:hypothetical protein
MAGEFAQGGKEAFEWRGLVNGLLDEELGTGLPRGCFWNRVQVPDDLAEEEEEGERGATAGELTLQALGEEEEEEAAAAAAVTSSASSSSASSPADLDALAEQLEALAAGGAGGGAA